MRSADGDGEFWLMVVLGLFFVASAAILRRHPEVFARRNFLFNVTNDQSEPRGWIVVTTIGGFGLVITILGVAGLLR
jgi:hypothetical protein